MDSQHTNRQSGASQTALWQTLQAQAASLADTHLAELFAGDPNRFDTFHRRCGPLLLDFSKQRITAEVLATLCELADARELRHWQAKLFDGEAVNDTEQRQALHWLLRQPLTGVQGAEVQNTEAQKQAPSATSSSALNNIHQQLAAMAAVVERLHTRQWLGAEGLPITDVVNLGVGGSHLGPLMATRALVDIAHQAAPTLHFVSTLDGTELATLLPELDPRTTLFIVSSKSFGTIDTLSNAVTARAWLKHRLALGDDILMERHFIGISARPDAMVEWGIPAQNHLQLWDWVGGRYSLWGVTGLPLALAIGMEAFRELLDGAHAMDRHTRETPWHDNLPVLMALIGHWNTNHLDIATQAILPYDGRLKHLPAYLMQLEMESNGKRTNRDGEVVAHNTCPVVFGDSGTNAQHSFFQLLHQGTRAVACDFIVPARAGGAVGESGAVGENGAVGKSSTAGEEGARWREHHQLSLANCLAQSRLLALGDGALGDYQSGDEHVPEHRRYPGNQPSSTLALDELTPYSLGALIALYEHKVFVQAVLWGINPFDQWGVEMGKRIATELLAPLQGRPATDNLDSSTRGLLAHLTGVQEK